MWWRKDSKNPCNTYTYATKQSIAINTNSLPIGCAISSVTRHDSRLFSSTISAIHQNIRFLPSTTHLDKTYDAQFCDIVLDNYSYKAIITRRKNRKNVTHKKSFHRWKAERTFS